MKRCAYCGESFMVGMMTHQKYCNSQCCVDARNKRRLARKDPNGKLCDCGCEEIVNLRQGRPNRFINGHGPRGKPRSKETKHKLSKALKGCEGHPHSDETKQKLSEDRKGKKNPFFGKRHTKKTKEKLRILNLGKECIPRYGPENPAWKGGISFEPYGQEFDEKLKTSIRERDGRICQLCGIAQRDYYRALDIHHIDYDKKNNDSSNLIALCNPCNARANGNRRHWQVFFEQFEQLVAGRETVALTNSKV